MKKTKWILIALLIVAFFAPTVFAQFGIGELVYDPSVYGNAVLMYGQLIQTVNQLQAQYQLFTRMAQTVPVNMATQYRAPATSWTDIQLPTDTYGKSAALASSLNGNGAPLAGYSQATQALDSYGNLLDGFSSEGQGHLQSRYSAVEFTDGLNLHAIQTVGDIQKNSAATENTIRSLETDSLSQNPDFNSEIALLQQDQCRVNPIRCAAPGHQQIVNGGARTATCCEPARTRCRGT